MPLLARTPKRAVVSSRLNPNSAATGPAFFMPSLNLSRSRAEPPKAAAMTSATRPLGRPQGQTVQVWNRRWPLLGQVLDRMPEPRQVSTQWLWLSASTESQLGELSWRSATDDAEKTVDAPKSSAFLLSDANSCPVAPETAFTFFIANSKSAATLNEEAPTAVRGAVIPRVMERPTAEMLLAVFLSWRWA